MKRSLSIAVLAALLLGARAADAQTLGAWTGAEILPAGGHMGGAYMDTGENTIGALGQLRMSFYPNIDFGFQGGLSRLDLPSGDRTVVRVGGDLRGGIASTRSGAPLDLALAGGLEVHSGDNYSLLSLGPMLFASRSFPAGSGSLTPYSRIGLAFENSSVAGESDNGIGVPLVVGIEYRPHPMLGIASQFQFNFGDSQSDDMNFGLGVNLPF